MQRTAIFLLLCVFAATHFASAENDDTRATKTATQNVQLVKKLTNTHQPRQIHRATNQPRNPNLNRNAGAKFAAPTNPGAQFNRPPRITPPVQGPTSPPVADVNAGAGNDNRFGRGRGEGNGTRDWRNRNGHGDGNRNWRNDEGNGNQGWRNSPGDDSFSNRTWKNRQWNGRHRGGHHWDRSHHDRNWWRSRYNRFALFGGGYYYWNSGFWYPAYGYDPYFSSYSYDAPVYGYNDLDPGQVIANVQAQLQRSGYYRGELDGQFGPMTRRALLDYQRDSGLEVTGEIDEATLDSLGLR